MRSLINGFHAFRVKPRATFVSLLVALFVTVIGCSGSGSASGAADKPSDKQVEDAVRAVVLTDGKDKIMTVENIKKINGLADDEKTYTADVTYDIVFKRSFEDLKKEYHPDDQKSEAQNGPVATYILKFWFANTTWKAGQHFPQSEKVAFIKSENGWIIENRL